MSSGCNGTWRRAHQDNPPAGWQCLQLRQLLRPAMASIWVVQPREDASNSKVWALNCRFPAEMRIKAQQLQGPGQQNPYN
ncbi:MAG: hypothetical protein EBR68_06415 [Synechococcaceae bacterium WB4_2_0811]|nr:hypothetical protein [Synechococcaceae bacterium WB4_2_0811]